jgi:hypothetical protein
MVVMSRKDDFSSENIPVQLTHHFLPPVQGLRSKSESTRFSLRKHAFYSTEYKLSKLTRAGTLDLVKQRIEINL